LAGRKLPEGFPIMRARASIPEHVVYRAFPNETVVLNLQAGKYHGLNPAGARILDALARDGSIEAAVNELASSASVPSEEVARDVAEFCTALYERELIEIDVDDGD
jgi:hypothetical protein